MARLDELIANEQQALVPPVGTSAANRVGVEGALASGWQVPAELAAEISSIPTAATTAATATKWGVVGKWLVAGAVAAGGVAAITSTVGESSDPAAATSTATPATNADASRARGRESGVQAAEGAGIGPTPPVDSSDAIHPDSPRERSTRPDRKPSAASATASANPTARDLEDEAPDFRAVGERAERSVAPARKTRRRADRTPRTREQQRPREDEAGVAFEQELDLLKSAKHQLDAGSIPRAERTLRRHAERFPDGTFAAEREAMLVVCECKRERDEPASQARAGQKYLRAHPRSPFASRVREACGIGSSRAKRP